MRVSFFIGKHSKIKNVRGEFQMKLSRFSKQIIAIVCSMAMVVAGLAFVPNNAKADDYSGLTYRDIVNNQNNEFDPTLKGSQYAVAEDDSKTLNILFQNVAFGELYISGGAWSAADLTATINGVENSVTPEGAGLRCFNCADYLDRKYNEIDVSWNGGTSKIIIYCPLKDDPETTTVDPSAPTTTAGPTTTAEPTTADPWTEIGGGAAHQWYWNNSTVQGVSVVSIQKPGFAEETGVYMTIAGTISSVSVNGDSSDDGYAIQGGGTVVYLSKMGKIHNDIIITDTNSNQRTITIKNTEGSDETTEPYTGETTTANPWKNVQNSDNELKYNNSTKDNISNTPEVQRNVGWADGHSGVYINFPSAVDANGVEVNGSSDNVAYIDGAQCLVYFTALDKEFNTVSITRAGGTSYIEIKNLNMADDWSQLSQFNPTARLQEDGGRKVYVSWSAVQDATSYTTFIGARVNGQEANTGGWIFKKRNQLWADNIARTDDSSIVLDYDNTYTFYVVAYNGTTPIATGSVTYHIPKQGQIGGDVVFTNHYREINDRNGVYYSELFANWDSVPGAEGYKSYIDEETDDGKAKANNEWVWSDVNALYGSGDKKIDTVHQTKGGTLIKPNESYTLIVVAFDSQGNEIGRGEQVFEAIEEPIGKTMDVDSYKDQETAPVFYGQMFAGFYQDATFTTPYMGTTGTAYAKFIDEDVFDVQFQEKVDDHKAIRFISSIDSLDYQAVGFTYSGTYGDRVIAETTTECNYVYKKITADGDTYNATDFNPNSVRLTTFTVRGMNGTTSSHWVVQPFVVTADGTTVRGQQKSYDMTIQ